MKRALRRAVMLAVLLAIPTGARAGWITQWTNQVTKTDGEKLPPETSTMSIEDGRVRIDQSRVVSVFDYKKNTYTLMNPGQLYFWSGTVDEYLKETARNRAASLSRRLGPNLKRKDADAEPAVPKLDPASLPPIDIRKTDQTKKIAGYDTIKYDVFVNGELFQELWIAPALDLSSDLDVDRFLAQQQKLSASMMGKAAKAYGALYTSPEFKKLVAKSFTLQTVTHHMGGTYDRTANEVRPADVPAAQFDIPDSYRRVRLADIFGDAKQTKP